MDVLVESFSSYVEANSPGKTVWSCSSGIENKLDDNKNFRSPEELVSRKEHNDLSKSIVESKKIIEDSLLDIETNDVVYKYLSTTHATQLYSLFLLAATKGQILSKWLESTSKNERIVIGSPDLKSVVGLNMGVGCYDNIFSVLIKLLGKVDIKYSILNEVSAVDDSLFDDVFSKTSFFDKIFNILNRNTSAITYKLWQRISNKTWSLNSNKTALILSDNEGIEEAFLGMVIDGWKVVSIKSDVKQISSKVSKNISNLEKKLFLIWLGCTEQHMSLAVIKACWTFLWKRISDAIKNHPENLLSYSNLVKGWKLEYTKNKSTLVLLSNGLYAPHERLLDSCLRDEGIPVICADHGSSIGLVKRHDYLLSQYISFSDYFLSYNMAAVKLYDTNKKRKSQVISLIRGPEILLDNKFSAFKKIIGRIYFKLYNKKSILMYVTSLTANNYPFGYSSTSDNDYVLFRERVVAQLEKYDGDVLIKPYPMHRYVDPEKIWEVKKNTNITIAPFCEFRNLRYVADILMLDISSSTISWAATSKIPIIYINNSTNALTVNAENEFKKAFFYVDSSEPDWEDKLMSILSMSLDMLNIEWSKMEKTRLYVIDNYIVSGKGSFKDGVLDALEKASTYASS